MKIISPFKDYYDYVQHVYGGGDPKIVYHRTMIGKPSMHSHSYIEGVSVQLPETPRFKLNSGYTVKTDASAFDYDPDWLVVCGKPYPLVGRIREHYELLDPDKHDLKKLSSYLRRDITPTGVENATLVAISKEIGHPVFTIRSVHRRGDNSKIDVDIFGQCPTLGEIGGFAAAYPAEQLYQDLSYFIVNKMQDSPDTMPAAKSTDKEKVLQHGFDLKQSFRHRK